MGDKTSSQPMKDNLTDASKEQTSGKSIASNDKLKDDGEMKDVDLEPTEEDGQNLLNPDEGNYLEVYIPTFPICQTRNFSSVATQFQQNF